jgi:hypothetical protein
MIHRKKPGLAFWATVAVVAVLVAYPLSIGPVSLIYYQFGRPHWLYSFEWYVYGPLLWTVEHGPAWYGKLFDAYVNWWAPM